MGVTIKSTNNIPKLKELLKGIGKKEMQAGVFGHDSNVDHEGINMVTLARVHEFGMTIIPKRARSLTIPLIPEAKGKRAKDFPDLFFYKPKGEDHAFLARKRGRGKSARIENVFLLVKSVTIPERSFIRAGFDHNIENIMRKIEKEMQNVIDFKINPELFADSIARELAGLIQRYARDLQTPPNSPITIAVKRSSNPLADTGRLIGSIDHRVK